ncbi:MAG: DNA adenine methylase, partial [Mycoplasmatales bacterium]|nr:DNA adenine methylase [Mycoplasmatales bacterium]
MQSISPLRYPGGKSRMYSKVEPLLLNNNYNEYAEPFSGGFGIGLLLLKNNIVNHVYINDLDKNVFSFWKLATTDFNFLRRNLKRVSNFTNLKEWLDEREFQKKIINSNKYGYKRKGFAMLFLNRVNRSGILSAGPIGGKEQKGEYKINCRFNHDRLLKQLEWIYSVRNKISITNLNYDQFVNGLNENVFIFLDPPYVVKGGQLYMNNFNKNDHSILRDFLLKVNNPWILTYDNDELIKKLYGKNKLKIIEFDLQ